MSEVMKLKHQLDKFKEDSDVSKEKKSESKVSRQVELPIVSCVKIPLKRSKKSEELVIMREYICLSKWVKVKINEWIKP